MQSKVQSPRLLKVNAFEAPDLDRVRIELVKRYKKVLLYPFYDRGIMRGYAISVNNIKKETRPIKWSEDTVRSIAFLNAIHHESKLFILLSKKKTETVVIWKKKQKRKKASLKK